MKITNIIPYLVWAGPRNLLLVKVETDDGIYGWGESGVSTREQAVKGAVAHYRNFLIGRDPRRIGALWQEMYRGQYFEGGRVLLGAISAIDIALYDLLGKSLGVPVYQLLGGAQREWVPCFATAKNSLSSPAVIDEVKKLIADGWDVIRVPPGHPDTHGDKSLYEPRQTIAMTAEWFVKLREAVGLRPVLGIDYHHRLSVAEAASFCQMMPSHTIDFIEEPIRDQTPSAYQALRRLTDVPFAIGEEISNKWDFMPYIEKDILNYCRMDLCNVGGFTEAMKVAAWCEAHYIDLMPHNPMGSVATAAYLHLAAAVPNFGWLEEWGDQNVFSSDLFPNKPVLEGTRYRVPDAPGLGIDVNEEVAKELEKKPYFFWECPHSHRLDGSYTNW